MNAPPRTIIVVPGARYLTSSNHLIRGAISRLYAFFNVIPCASDSEEGWIRPLRDRGYEIVRFSWSGNVSRSSIRSAAADLSSLVRGYDSVILVSCSLGSDIAIRSDSHERISRMISLCGVYGHATTPFPIIDIRSSDDRFGNLCHSLLNVFTPRSPATETILLEGIRHDEFGLDPMISSGIFHERRISEIIGHYLA